MSSRTIMARHRHALFLLFLVTLIVSITLVSLRVLTANTHTDNIMRMYDLLDLREAQCPTRMQRITFWSTFLNARDTGVLTVDVNNDQHTNAHDAVAWHTALTSIMETCHTCGNGIHEGEEMCDDGNGTNGDGCSVTCRTEPCFRCDGSPSVCIDERSFALPTGPMPSGIAIAGTTAFVLHAEGVTVIDLHGKRVEATLKTPYAPEGIAIAGTRVYVESRQSGGNMLSAISTFDLPTEDDTRAGYAGSLVLTGSKIYRMNNPLTVTDAPSGRILHTLANVQDRGVLLLTENTLLLHGNYHFAIIDPETDTLIRQLMLGYRNPTGIAQHGDRIFAAGWNIKNDGSYQGIIDVIDRTKGTLMDTIRTNRIIQGIAATDTHIIATLQGGGPDNVLIIRPEDHTIVSRHTIGSDPHAIVGIGDSLFIRDGNTAVSGLHIMDAATHAKRGTLEVAPWITALSAQQDTLLVTSARIAQPGALHFIDPLTPAVLPFCPSATE